MVQIKTERFIKNHLGKSAGKQKSKVFPIKNNFVYIRNSQSFAFN